VANRRGDGVASRADEYRRLARECLLIARTIATERTRASLLEMAQVWLRLADERAATSVPPRAVEEHRPAVQQQQQQIQPKVEDKNE
jgi:hypothetical protein